MKVSAKRSEYPPIEPILSLVKSALALDEIFIEFNEVDQIDYPSLSSKKIQEDTIPAYSSQLSNKYNSQVFKFGNTKTEISGALILIFKKQKNLEQIHQQIIDTAINEIVKIEAERRRKVEESKLSPLNKEIVVKNLIGSLSEGAIIFDTSNNIIHINAIAQNILGLSRKSKLNKEDLYVNFHKEDGVTLVGKDDQPSSIALSGKKLTNARYFIQQSQRLLVNINANPIFDHENTIIAAVVTLSDITSSVYQKEELETQKNILSLASELAEVGYWDVNFETETIYWSDITHKIHETDPSYKPNLKEGINFYDEESRPLITELINKSIETGEGWDIKLKIITAKGNSKWVRSISQCYQKNGKTFKITGVFQDVTKEKLLEERLITSRNKVLSINEHLAESLELKDEELNFTKERYSLLYNNAPDLMASIDTESKKIINCNEKIAKELGYNKSDLIGKSVFELYDSSCLTVAKITFAEFLEKGSVSDKRLTLLRKNGSKINVMLNASAIKNKDGEIIQTNSVWRDISELVKSEEKIKALNATLEEKVKERTKELELANNEIEEFTYMASHDLKAPIANIKGHIGIIQNELGKVNNSVINDCFMWIDNSIRVAETKIQSIIKVAHLRFQNQKKSELLDVEKEIKKVLINLDSVILESNAEITVNIIKPFKTEFIAEHFESVLSNLLHNAIKYKQSNQPPRITIEVNYLSDAPFIAITDNGIGFDPIIQKEKIFGMFQRIHDHIEGDGMGLYFVKKTIDKSGGRITVKSKIGQGSTFTVFFNNKTSSYEKVKKSITSR